MNTYSVFARSTENYDKNVEFSYSGRKLLKIGDLVTLQDSVTNLSNGKTFTLLDIDEKQYKIIKHIKL